MTISPKNTALALLALVSLVGPLVERWWTGRVEPLGTFDLANALVSLPLVFWWYHVDKRQRSYEAGPLMNVGIVAASLLAFPVYFVRSRGWRRGMVATLFAAGFLAITLALGELGERIGAVFSSW